MAKPPSRRTVQRAIAIIEDSQYTHQRAIHEPESQALGSEAFHRKCIEEYEEVLRLLRRVQQGIDA